MNNENEHIFKYTDINGAKEILKSNSILMKTPDQFNDPNDCDFAVSDKELQKSAELFQEYSALMEINDETQAKCKARIQRSTPLLFCAKGIIVSNNITIPKNHLFEPNPLFRKHINKQIASDKKAKENYRKNIENYKKRLKEILNECRQIPYIGCLSTTPSSCLMWAHYSDEFRGVCIEWSVPRSLYGDVLFKVVYSKEKPKLDLYHFTKLYLGYKYIGEEFNGDEMKLSKRVENLIITKSEEWSYENEVRFAVNKTQKGQYEIKDIGDNRILYHMCAEPIKVYLGERISAEDEKNIRDLCLKYRGCTVVKTKHSNERYCIDEIPEHNNTQ